MHIGARQTAGREVTESGATLRRAGFAVCASHGVRSCSVSMQLRSLISFLVIESQFHAIVLREDAGNSLHTLRLWRLVLCPSTWLVWENIPCVLEKNVYYGFFLDVMSGAYQVSLFYGIIQGLCYFTDSLEDLSIGFSGVKVFYYYCVPLSCSFTSVQFSPSVMSDSLQPHGLQHARPPCPSPAPGVYSNSCPLSW